MFGNVTALVSYFGFGGFGVRGLVGGGRAPKLYALVVGEPPKLAHRQRLRLTKRVWFRVQGLGCGV
jgi:hypothetical protein